MSEAIRPIKLITVDRSEFLTNSFLIAIVAAGLVVLYFEGKNYLDLPDVLKTSDGKCVLVVNYKNGDGYSCPDVDVTLRRYHLSKV